MLRKHADEYSGEDDEHVAVEFENSNDESVNQSDMSSYCNISKNTEKNWMN